MAAPRQGNATPPGDAELTRKPGKDPWDTRSVPRSPVAAPRVETRGRAVGAARPLLLLLLLVFGCIPMEAPTARGPDPCGLAGLACCSPDAGPLVDAAGLQRNGCGPGLTCAPEEDGRRVCQPCSAALQVCNGACIARDDRNHCGACGNACNPGFDCLAGDDGGTPRCERSCAPNQRRCGSGSAQTCVNPESDPAHCGACNTPCTAAGLSNVVAAVCTAGACTISNCASNFGNCDQNTANGCEVNTLSNPLHCGACGRACAAPPNAMSLCRNASCDFACLPGFADCDRNPANGCEADLGADPLNCRACAMVCMAPAGRTPTCVAGVCGSSAGLCPTGRGDCDGSEGNGCETDLNSALSHCGRCGRACNLPNATATCVAGQCALGSCNGSFRNCDGELLNGCEANTGTSTAHCGACGRACAFDNAAANCNAGTCSLGTCNPGFGNCDGLPANGCEASLQSDRSHCGACGRGCAAGEVCTAGTCMRTCAAGQTLCSGACVDLQTSAAHCGTCGRACPAGQSCAAGTCMLVCPTGTVNCSGACVNPLTSVSHCGPAQPSSCGMACTLANAVNTCNAGICAIGACNPGFGNCDNLNNNGCETSFATSTTACGGCGNNCNALPNVASVACASGTCNVLACDAGFGNCNALAADGCETNTLSSAMNCGGCGVTCPSGGAGNTLGNSCLGGRCLCATNFRDCDGSRSNGCEVNRLNDASNCGECGVRCAGATPNCLLGTCVGNNCGNAGQPCCGGNLCGPNLACLMEACTSECGGEGQACCAGNTCSATLRCSGGVCAIP